MEDQYSELTEAEYIARQIDGLNLDMPTVIRHDTPYSSEFGNLWGLKACPNRLFLYGDIMAVWYHSPELEGFVNAETDHDEFLPYAEFEVFAMEQGWD